MTLPAEIDSPSPALWPTEPAVAANHPLAGLPLGRPRCTGGLAKRALDLPVALTALIMLAPLMLAVALLIKLTTRGPVLFGHARVGLNGRTFRCLKFRTMRPDAEQALLAYLADSPEAAQEWLETRKLKKDPRVTALGKVLRGSSIDELPQLLNVLRGEMSCVGPRPVIADELALYGAQAQDYLAARPGLTGPWQVSGRSALSYADRVSLDSAYVRNWSLRRDIVILLKTVPAVMRFDRTS
ncbi:exopolysaccharide biosynthesis protein [Azorhizobium oxalatiphilum]|uniref:Exopolysaccharide biosynthesis protein n=1 Tax=Azorhizobium oxalatiphilum TaxID=980631 RepID=A0A917BPV6_9HYPH|nr:sugar transferase [Azorhizobium oxalatiphilum]GGF54272.1 exopolysaccharide biosynthesis protein [Azorhizobium oxalatiphilum]